MRTQEGHIVEVGNKAGGYVILAITRKGDGPTDAGVDPGSGIPLTNTEAKDLAKALQLTSK